ncbi:hypothetical protein R1sor_024779 [Riccia sorocarpa]|uniref:J domain-containing protein n=1 Tax=Riccia sorocarpa TaxID=122646 RepID=A0ABD3GRM6_9MARC
MGAQPSCINALVWAVVQVTVVLSGLNHFATVGSTRAEDSVHAGKRPSPPLSTTVPQFAAVFSFQIAPKLLELQPLVAFHVRARFLVQLYRTLFVFTCGISDFRMFYRSMLQNCVKEIVAMSKTENCNLESKDTRHSCSGGGEGDSVEMVEFVRSESERATPAGTQISASPGASESKAYLPSKEVPKILGGAAVDPVVDKCRPRSSLLEDHRPHVSRKSSATLRDQRQQTHQTFGGKTRHVKSRIISRLCKSLVFLRILAHRGVKFLAPRRVSPKAAVTSCDSQDPSKTVGKRTGHTEVEGTGPAYHLGGRVLQEKSKAGKRRAVEGRTKTPHPGEGVTDSGSDVPNATVTNAAAARVKRCIIGKSLRDLFDVLDSQKQSSGSTASEASSTCTSSVSSGAKSSESSPPSERNFSVCSPSVHSMAGETKQKDSPGDYHHDCASRQAEKKCTRGRVTTTRKDISSRDNPTKQGVFTDSPPSNWVRTKEDLAGNANFGVDRPPATFEQHMSRSVRYGENLEAEVSENQEKKTEEDLPATRNFSTEPLPGTLKRLMSGLSRYRENIRQEGSKTQETKTTKHLAKTRNLSADAPQGSLKRQISRLVRFIENHRAEGSENQQLKTNKNLAELGNSSMEPPVKPQKSRSARFWENLKGLAEESCNQEEKGDTDVFHEIEGESIRHRQLRYQQFKQLQSCKRASKKIKEMHQQEEALRKEREEKMKIACELDPHIIRWCSGKEGDLRELLTTLQNVLWPECTMWKVVSLSDLESPSSVKKVYRRASFCLHPDKVQQRGGTLRQIYIAEKIFGVLREAWNKFHAEELI